MFVHGSRASAGSGQYHQRDVGAPYLAIKGSVNCTLECGSETTGELSSVCDDTCRLFEHDQWGYRRLSCGAGDASRYGPHCRRCYADADEAQAVLAARPVHHAGDGGDEHVIMCDTKRPPPSQHCSLECAANPDTASARNVVLNAF